MNDPDRTYDYDAMWRDVYGDLQEYGPSHYHMKRIYRRLLREIEYHSVLDVGCGPGHNYAMLSKNGSVPRYDGIDISERALACARARLPGQFWQCDIQKEYQPQTWDLVFCSLVLEHLLDDDAAIGHLRRMTGRYLLIGTIAGDFERYRPWEAAQGHVRNYRVGELEEKLRAHGFTIRRALHWGFPFYSPIARRLQNLNVVGTGAYSLGTRLLARTLRLVYYLNSHRRGDVVFVLASVP